MTVSRLRSQAQAQLVCFMQVTNKRETNQPSLMIGLRPALIIQCYGYLGMFLKGFGSLFIYACI